MFVCENVWFLLYKSMIFVFSKTGLPQGPGNTKLSFFVQIYFWAVLCGQDGFFVSEIMSEMGVLDLEISGDAEAQIFPFFVSRLPFTVAWCTSGCWFVFFEKTYAIHGCQKCLFVKMYGFYYTNP